MRPLLVLTLTAACAHKPTTVHPVAPARPGVATPVARPTSPWPVPMRVMAWTARGTRQIGRLPDAPPRQYPMRWFVEPAVRLDRATYDRVIGAVRSEHVPGLSLRGQPVSGWLDELHDLPELHALLLGDTAVGSEEVAALDLSLDRLYLARTQIDDRALTPRLASLEVLDIEDTAITDRGLATIAGYAGLHALDAAGTRITDRGGAALGALHDLRILDLGGTKIGASTIAAIRPLALAELFIDHTYVGPEIATLAGYAPGLVRFDASALATYRPTDADVGWLARAPNLVEVGLSGARVHDPLVTTIAGRRGIRILRLADTQIRSALEPISRLDHLEEVDLGGLPVSDEVAARLLAGPHLRMLRLDNTMVGDAALHDPSPALRELYLSKTAVTDAGLAILDQLPELEALGLGKTGVGDETVDRIAKLDQLHTLVLTSSRARAETLAKLGRLHDLERLYLDGTHADDDTARALAPLRDLRVLHLASTDVSPAALPTLRTFVHLDELTIGFSKMSTAVAELAAWPHLRKLSVAGLEISNRDLAAIARRPSLTLVDLSFTEVTDPAPLAALSDLRTLGLVETRLSAAGIASAHRLAKSGVALVLH